VTGIGFVGAGRAGAGLGAALAEAGYRVRLHGRKPREIPASIEFTYGGRPPWLNDVDALVLAVPDDVLGDVARDLAADERIAKVPVVLHLSGVLDSKVLQAVASRGCAVGSMHPLQSLTGVTAAAERLRGAAAAIEGDPKAMRLADELATALRMTPLRIPAAAKPLYHAAAVFASNYLVVLAAIAERLLERAGVSHDDASAALAPIIRGTVENVVQYGANQALTGPVARGDGTTVRKHLEALPAEEAVLYRALGRAALDIARLNDERRKSVARELES
jgi:predicted short-subunit dehydrogenase-like oxidoreductase (DUF2520 family)